VVYGVVSPFPSPGLWSFVRYLEPFYFSFLAPCILTPYFSLGFYRLRISLSHPWSLHHLHHTLPHYLISSRIINSHAATLELAITAYPTPYPHYPPFHIVTDRTISRLFYTFAPPLRGTPVSAQLLPGSLTPFPPSPPTLNAVYTPRILLQNLYRASTIPAASIYNRVIHQ